MLTFVTGNYGKYVSVKNKFSESQINLNYYKCDLEEPNINDIDFISKTKAYQAYEKIKKPCFVSDTGFYVEHYPNHPNYPGAFAKRSGVSTNIDQLLDTLKDTTNRHAYFLDCLTFYDGQKFYTFYGRSEGTIAFEKRGLSKKEAKSNLWLVFIPQNHHHTLAEMTDEELNNRHDNHTSATDLFLKWYLNEYQKNK